MTIQFPPKFLGERNDKDTQFIAFAKDNQDMILGGGVIVILALLFLAYTVIFPSQREGTWRYGICKTFLEQYATYPTKLKILTAIEKQGSSQIGYINTNSFGTQQSELMECFYAITPQGPIVKKITIDRRSVFFDRNTREKPHRESVTTTDQKPISAQEIVNLYEQDASTTIKNFNIDQFNASIPTILANDDLDFVMPNDFPKNLEGLKYD